MHFKFNWCKIYKNLKTKKNLSLQARNNGLFNKLKYHKMLAIHEPNDLHPQSQS